MSNTRTAIMFMDKVYPDKVGGGSGGTEVIPNPSEEPTAALETIQIEDTVYNIPGEGSANIVELTQAEYDALPDTKLSDDVLYMVHSDGTPYLDPAYTYITYGDNDEIVIRIFDKDGPNERTLWFFNGFTKTGSDWPVPSELQPYLPNHTTCASATYDSDSSTTQTGWIGFYAGLNPYEVLRTWTIDWDSLKAGTFYAVVNTELGQYQQNEYTNPYIYKQDNANRIYLNGKCYSDDADLIKALSMNEYNLLSHEEKMKNALYLIQDNKQDPNYLYRTYNFENGLGTLVIEYTQNLSVSNWYFNNVYITNTGMDIPTELLDYLPTVETNVYRYTKGWDAETKTTHINSGGIYNEGGTYRFRLLSTNLQSYITGTLNGWVDATILTSGVQDNAYVDKFPSQYIIYKEVIYNSSSGGGSIGGASALEDLEDVELTSPIDGQVLTYDATNDVWINANASGGAAADELTLSEYEELTATQKNDGTIRFIPKTDGGTINLINPSTDWGTRIESGTMQINWANSEIDFLYNGAMYIGAMAVRTIAIPAEATKIKYKVTTGTSYTTNDPYKFAIGVKDAYDVTNWSFSNDNNWLEVAICATNNTVFEGELDLSEITTDSYLYIVGHGWNATIEQLEYEIPNAGNNSQIKYLDKTYGNPLKQVTSSQYKNLTTPQKKDRDTLYLINDANDTITNIDMSNITIYHETNATIVDTSSSQTDFEWSSGSLIGQTCYYTPKVDLTNIDIITYDLITEAPSYGSTYGYNYVRNLAIGVNPTAPPSNTYCYTNLTFTKNNIYTDITDLDKTLIGEELDVSDLTGEYYIIMAAAGWNASVQNMQTVTYAEETSRPKIIYRDTDYTVPTLEAQELNSSQYNNLPTVEKEDDKKVYFINDTFPHEVETPVNAYDFVNAKEGSMNITVLNNELIYDWLGGSSIGASSFYPIAIPADVLKIKYKITTGSSYSTTTQRFKIAIGVKANYSTSTWASSDDTNWLAVDIQNTQNTVYEGEVDLSEITTDSYLMIGAHGWDVTFNEIKLVTMGQASDTKIMYKNIEYGTGGGEGGSAITTLFENSATTSPSTITLEDDLTNYDLVLFQLGATAGDALFSMIYDVADLSAGDTVGAGSSTNIFVWYYYTDATTLTLRVSAGNVYMSKIIGIKLNSGGGGGGEVSATHYHVFGIILDSHSGGTMTARGCADITITGNLARVDFMITEKYDATHSDGYNWGINPALFTQIDSNIPLITPIAEQGSWDAFGYNRDRMQYGTTFDLTGNRWRPVRYYTTNGDTGAWSETAIPDQYRGTCYGTIQS